MQSDENALSHARPAAMRSSAAAAIATRAHTIAGDRVLLALQLDAALCLARAGAPHHVQRQSRRGTAEKSPLPRCASQHLSARRPTAQVRLLPNAVEAGVFNVTLTTEGAGRALGWNTPHIPSGLPFDPGAGSVLVWNRAEEHCRPGGVGLDVVSSRLQV